MAKIDFDGINAAALARYPQLLESWLPDGKVQGKEYTALNPTRDDTRTGSFKINIQTGVWSDFATGDEDGDPVSLYAYLNGLKQGEAAIALAKELGIKPSPRRRSPRRRSPRKQADRTTNPQSIGPRDLLPPPETIRHHKLGLPDRSWSYLDPEGNVLGYVCRFDISDGKEIRPYTPHRNKDGKSTWQWKAFHEPRPLYGLQLLLTSPSMPVMIFEGEKAAEAAQSLVGDQYVCMTWPGGSKAVSKADWSPLRGHTVFIWPDADKPGFQAALDIAQSLGAIQPASITFITPPSDTDNGWDIADAVEDGWDAERTASWIDQNAHDEQSFRAIAKEGYGIMPKEKRNHAALAFPFILREDGVCHLNTTRDGTEDEFLCSPLRVLALARDNDGQSWGRLLEVQDPDGNLHRWSMPMSMTAGSGETYRSILMGMGLRPISGHKYDRLLQTYITQHPVDARARCVPRIGWHQSVFVLPDEVFGQDSKDEVVLQVENLDHAFRVSDTLEEWQRSIGRLSEGNSRLAFAIATAFAAPLLEPLGMESGGFHFIGGSSIGKTTILEVAGSVCGGGGIGGFIQPWRTTDNALEGIAANHCDSLLCLDEIGQVDARVAGDVAYMLANGQGKSRARKDGTKRKAQEWRLLFLSSGELTLADKIRETGNRRATAGQAVRIVDIPADAGVGLGAFDTLHDEPDGHAFVQRLKDAAKNTYGQPIRAYLAALVQDREALTRHVAMEMRHYSEALCPPLADGQVKRVCGRFALIASAGELAIRLGILPWPKGTARQATQVCFNAWLDARGGTEPAEIREGLEQVKHFFEAHGASRFEDLDLGDMQRVPNRAGFKQENRAGGYDYYVLPETFKKEVCQGFHPTDICKALAERGLLRLSSEGKHQVNKSIPHENGRKQMKVYHFLPGILGGIDG